jgi:alanine racemase
MTAESNMASAQPAKPAVEPRSATWVEVSRAALSRNFRAIQSQVGSDVTVCPVIKSDAYGHGAAGCALALCEAGAKWLAVGSVDEGIGLRQLGVEARVLILSGFWRGEEEEIVRHRLSPAVWDPAHVALLENAAAKTKFARPVAVHLKVNTGMNRLGADLEEMAAIYDALRAAPRVLLEGIFSHFASSEVVDQPHGNDQLRQFNNVVSQARRLGFTPAICHMANSAAIVSRPASWFNLVRPGLAIYGYCLPLARSTQQSAFSSQQTVLDILRLQPALAWKTRVLQVREVAAGEQVGYSGGYIARSTTKVAILAAGYGDGLSRKLSSRGRVIVRDAYAPIIGNVSMNLTAADVTLIPGVAVGDVVTLIGSTPSCSISAWDHANLASTIPYEILCNVSGRLPRLYVE